ncbi:anthranilate synthase component I [Salinicoccus halodurans]|uniref:Anthranilate synthase component 1 n=1 Tax=Salinicoccus halodurans TaxID=407035 RepID=A0A0F7D4L5_9STAP|nr:anthranilate synthase component I [Salinicoccus halodurans]AKG74445.1 anthranilate synthase component I [Salinicoccus halodurans]SFK96105.1 anthranilate synthase, component I [Salinicoccus halodurans]
MTTYEAFLNDAKTFRTVPVVQSFYTDVLTPVHMFHALKDEAAYMLESQEPGSPWSNFSFIGINPMIDVTEVNNEFVIRDLQYSFTAKKPSFKSAFDTVLAELKVKIPEIDIPFKGGGVGYISYDAISDYEPVQKAIVTEEKLPNYHLLFCQTLLAYNHRTKKITILTFARISEDKSPREIYDRANHHIRYIRDRLVKNSELSDLMMPVDLYESPAKKMESNYGKDKFKEDVGKIKEYITKGDILQAVLSQRFHTKTERSGFELYRVLRNVNPSPYMYYLKFNDVEVIGSSPERQLQVQDGKLEIHPIAGTRKRGKTKEEDDRLAEELLNDEKEIAEHRMLVDLARNDIGRVSVYGTVTVSDYMTIGKFSKVMHIISKVNGDLRDEVSPIDAFISSFPAGTLSGAPKVRAMQILRELEPTPRNLYGGSILYLGFDGNMDSCITIRTMTLSGNDLYIQAGAGVVADSDPESEYQETINKASALEKAVHLSELIFREQEVHSNA